MRPFRNINADIIRILAVVSIIAVHVYYPLYSRPNYFGGISWWYAHIVSIFGHMGVPLFLMLSGYLVLPKLSADPIKNTLSRTLYRLIIPCVFWTMVYLWGSHKWLGFIITPHILLSSTLTSGFFHLYFLVILITLYLLTPLMQQLLIPHQARNQKYLLTISLITTIIVGIAQYVERTQTLFTVSTMAIPYVSYYLLGFVIKNRVFSRKELWQLAFAFMGMLFFTIVASARNMQLFAQKDLFLWRGGGNQYFTDYLSINIVIMSAIAFIFLLRTPFERFLKSIPLATALVTTLSLSAYGMYLIHPIIIDYLDIKHLMIIHIVTSNLWLYITKKMILVLIISGIIATIVRHLPIIKLVVGEKE